MKAYRVEDSRNHMGPFNDPACPIAGEYCCMMSNGKPTHTINDQIEETRSHFKGKHIRYGCTNLDAIRKWFPFTLRLHLKDFGFQLVEYDLEAVSSYVVVEDNQIVFVPSEAKARTVLNLVKGE